MDTAVVLSWLLGVAVLLPLGSFVLIFLLGPYMGKGGRQAGVCATSAILLASVLSFIALFVWLAENPPAAQASHGGHGESHVAAHHDGHEEDPEDHDSEHSFDSASAEPVDSHTGPPPSYSREVYTLGVFGEGRKLSISVYIDALTVCMFCMVTLIATCIHFYATGYMHDELEGEEYVDHEVTMSDGSHLRRPGRYHRFFQALSLFCFSMLGLVLSGNVAMTFMFWELVGICSYFLIGFYVERHSASTAANKAFIVNRVGDFGMIIGLMAIWGSLGTFSFAEIFEQVRPESNGFHLQTPDGMVQAAAGDEVATLVRGLGPTASPNQIQQAIAGQTDTWRDPEASGVAGGYGRWLLIIAGVGMFCGCVGKSAQFPLHTWLPDAMEGPTPVSALVHSATMVAAGVFLVARFYPVFAPEVLLVIAVVGTITLFLAATIAITATDIKRVLAYSTVSQLGYMMLALGLGGWLAGVMHLFTHAFFKSLLFMCSGSVIHAVHTNEMTEMGGLRKKMPWTAYTMLVGCLAIAGAGLPFALSLGSTTLHLGFSGFYSKDAILEQALLFRNTNPLWGNLFFVAAAGGAAITAFYMFRLWYLTFAGEPRDAHRYEHAHESPPVMYRPLILLAVMAIGVAWRPVEGIVGSVIALLVFGFLSFRNRHSASGPVSSRPVTTCMLIAAAALLMALVWMPRSHVSLGNLLEQARPAGILDNQTGAFLPTMVWPNEHDSHAPAIKVPATWIAFSTALAGFLLATVFYGTRKLDAGQAKRAFAPIHRFLLNKWWFDELYDFLFVRPCHVVSRWIANFDLSCIDEFLNGLAKAVRVFANFWEGLADRTIVDGTVNLLARTTYRVGSSLRRVQTGNLRQYVMFLVVGTVVLFALASFWRYAFAQ